MNDAVDPVNLSLLTDISSRDEMLSRLLCEAGVEGNVSRRSATPATVRQLRASTAVSASAKPDLVIFDFAYPNDRTIAILRELAFGAKKLPVPIIVMTSPDSLATLDAGEVDGGDAIMFSPTSLPAFVHKLRIDNRQLFLKALRTLYQFGPILVRTPQAVLHQDQRESRIPA